MMANKPKEPRGVPGKPKKTPPAQLATKKEIPEKELVGVGLCCV